jgi:hypothetical protein
VLYQHVNRGHNFSFQSSINQLHVPYTHADVIIAWKKNKAFPLVNETESGMLNIISAWLVCILFPCNVRPEV